MATTPATPPPSLREIALRAGVSRMAVSRAFKPGAEISDALRARVLRVAAEAGYRPDPLVGEIMTHFARGRRAVHRATLGVLWWDAPSRRNDGYSVEIRRGLETAARRYGCRLDHLSAIRHGDGLERVLETRGIRSLILTPAFGRVEVSIDLDWEKFSVVAVGNSLRKPQVHRVVHSHYASAVRAMEELAARGYRKPALVVETVTEERIRRAYSAAFLARQDGAAARRIFLHTAARATALADWLSQRRPDAVLVGHDGLLTPALLRHLSAQGAGVVSLDLREDARPVGGIRQHPRSMAAWAVDLLMQMRWRGETGIPAEPATLTVEGTWMPGGTVRALAAGALP